MKISKLDAIKWETLIFSIQQKKCILMLGPDVSTEEMKGMSRPLTEILANKLAKKIEPGIKKRINIDDLAEVSQFYYMKEGRHALEAQVSSFYGTRLSLTNDFHMNLAYLPFYFTVTTTPDNMFFQALQEKGKIPHNEFYNFKGKKPGNVVMGTTDKPLVFDLYGKVDDPTSLLLTEDDLLDFLVALISKNPPLPDNILSELGDESKCFLFLGFGFRHWYLRILLHVLKIRSKGAYSFALEQFMPINTTELERTIFFFQKSDFKIHIFKDDLGHFARQLREKYEKWTKKGQPPPPDDKKSVEVFICHVSENKDDADRLYAKLDKAGFKPWLDKKNLRGGDYWDSEIKDTINKVDYFVVLQSKDFSKKHESYVFKEIKRALSRQEKFKKGIKFIIPVKIEDCDLVKELDDIQTIDLTDEANIKELITTITRDFEKRRMQ